MKFLEKLFGKKTDVPRIDVRKRFDLVGRVGQGSMSKVWRARDTKTGRVCALKVLDKEKTERFEARFNPKLKKPSEGEIAVQLIHPNIVRTYEYGYTLQGEQWLAMEFVEGVSLSFLIDVQNDQMRENCLDYAIQLGDAIAHFHEQKWIHRDVCPRNVIVSEENQVKLIDFGLVVPNTPDFQAPGNRTGTANYMAPELIKRRRTDQRIDVFSYAVTVFEMYTREKPWPSGQSMEAILQHINNPPKDVREIRPEIDEQVAETVMRGLAAEPADRWPSMTRMLEPLREAHARLNRDTATRAGG